MEISRLSQIMNNTSLWILRLAQVNLLWIFFTLLGVVVLGFFPATLAMFTVVKKWIDGETDLPIFKTFYHRYRTDFLKINSLGFVLIIIFLISLYNIISYFFIQENVPYLVQGIIMILFILFAVFCLYFFPVYTHFELHLFHYFKQTFYFSIVAPLHTLIVLSITGIFFILFIKFPALAVFFGGSIVVYCWMWLFSKLLLKVERKKNYIVKQEVLSNNK